MYLIDTTSLKLYPFMGGLPSYVILSHTWGNDEVTFDNMQNPDTLNKNSKGYQKIKECCRQAKEDCYGWAWVDTCCIDKRSSAELSEAINSMYRYYWEAEKCYTYLSDVCVEHKLTRTWDDEFRCAVDERFQFLPKDQLETSARPPDLPETFPYLRSPYRKSFRTPEDISTSLKRSRWFKRGWTLQELLAPAVVEFYDKHWTLLGTKSSLATEIGEITDIDTRYLYDRTSIKATSLGLRFSWASKRQTTRDEDIAYCLLGIVGVNMPLLYGEGKRAFRRLQVEILKQTRDHTMFAWADPGNSSRWYDSQSFLAPSPAYFQALFLTDVRPTFLQTVESSVLEMTALGLHITLPCIGGATTDYIVAVLDCSKEDDTRIGIKLKLLRDGRYRRFEYEGFVQVSLQQIEQAVTKELYILDGEMKERGDMERQYCAFKVGSLTMEGLSISDVQGCFIYLYKPLSRGAFLEAQQSLIDVRAFCDNTVEVLWGNIVCFNIKLRCGIVTVFGSEVDGRSWLRVVLSENESALRKSMHLLEVWGPEHLRDYVTASRGANFRVDVHARKKRFEMGGFNESRWHLSIHICAGSAMSLL